MPLNTLLELVVFYFSYYKTTTVYYNQSARKLPVKNKQQPAPFMAKSALLKARYMGLKCTALIAIRLQTR